MLWEDSAMSPSLSHSFNGHGYGGAFLAGRFLRGVGNYDSMFVCCGATIVNGGGGTMMHADTFWRSTTANNILR